MSKQKKIFGFIALAIAMFMGTLDSTIINIALPDIMNYFKAGLNDTSWISTIYVLGLSVFMIPASKFADQFGRKKVLLIGLVLFGGSSALCGLSNSLLFLIIMRLIQGIGGAIITPIVVPMAIELFGTENTQKTAGAIGAITALAAAGGPPIGGLLIKYINWQSIFFVNVPFSLISVALTILFINESYDKTVSKSIDFPGMLFLMMTLFLLTFPLLKGSEYGWQSAIIISMFAGSVISLVLFLITEKRSKAPLVELYLFKESTFTASNICYMITGFGIVAPLLIFNYFLQNALNYDALSAAYIIMTVSLTVIISMPLGSIIASKLGARPVNFSGVLFMSIGAFMLSKLNVDTSKLIMTLDMITFGFGLGFSCQSLVSSIKHLPSEKNGIGSGIVNAARQIGTCLGIAILVSILNSNVTAAKNDIKKDSIGFVNHSHIIEPVKKVIDKDIIESFNSSSNSTPSLEKLRSKLEKDIKNAMSNVTSISEPSDNTLLQLYNGLNTLSDGESQLSDGQKSLNDGITSFSSGISTLKDGSTSLSSNLDSFNSGLTKVNDGVQSLNLASGQNLNLLNSGIDALNDGAQKLFSQFSPGSDSNSPTVYDGVTGLSNGIENFSSSLTSYINAVNNTYYLMIKSSPQSPYILNNLKSSLSNAKISYASCKNEQLKEQYKSQIQMLSNLVTLYTAGTDPNVKDEKQFENKLANMAAQDKNNENMVSNGNNIKAGSDKLTNISQKVAGQFKDGGSFKSGMKQLTSGISTLEQKKSSITSLKAAINKLTDSLSMLQNGSSKLADGSKKLQNGLETANSNSDRLKSGSNQLIDASSRIKDGTEKIKSEVSLYDQHNEIKNVLKNINSTKDDKIEKSFDKTFLFSAIILLVFSVFGLFTDKSAHEDISDTKASIS